MGFNGGRGVDVTITATLRPELFEATLQSFWENIFAAYAEKHKIQAIMNIDPVGGPPSAIDKMAKLCRKYFPSSFVIISEKAHFGRAFYKVWSMAGTTSPFVFHLEDDWQLVRKVSLLDMVEIFSTQEALQILRLPQNDAPADAGANYKDWNLLYPYNGLFYEVPISLRGTVGFCGHPSLVRSDFVRRSLHFLDKELNPEKQLKGVDFPRRRWLHNCRLGVYTQPGQPKAIKDIGRAWRQAHGIEKKGVQAFFTEWVYG